MVFILLSLQSTYNEYIKERPDYDSCIMVDGDDTLYVDFIFID